jgi:MFS family permease
MPESSRRQDSILAPPLAPITVALMAVLAVAAFSATSVVAILPTIAADIRDVRLVPWVLTAYLLTSTVVLPMTGPVIDRAGLRWTFRAAAAGLAVSSLLCALAPGAVLLVLARALQGAAAGFGISVAISGIGLVFNPRLRLGAFALGSTVWGATTLAAPMIAVALLSFTDWRLTFVVNAVLALVAGVIGWRRLPGTATSMFRFDWLGGLLLGSAAVAAVAATAWFDGRAVVAVGGMVLLGTVYWWHSGRADHPLLERRLLVSFPYGPVHVAGAAAFAAAVGLDAFLPLYVSAALGRGPLLAGSVVVFMAVGWAAGSILVSRLGARYAVTGLAVAGYGLVSGAVLVVATTFDESQGLAVVFCTVTVLGLGGGAVATSMLTTLQGATTQLEMGRASGAHQFVRSLGQTIGTAVVGGLILYAMRVGGHDAASDTGLLAGAPSIESPSIASAVSTGIRWAASVMVPVVGGGALAALSLHRRTKPGLHQASMAP